jgi:hypothetical protein
LKVTVCIDKLMKDMGICPYVIGENTDIIVACKLVCSDSGKSVISRLIQKSRLLLNLLLATTGQVTISKGGTLNVHTL